MTETAKRAASPRWLELGEQQRSAVVDAILDVVAEGDADLTVAELSARAGISRPTFYKYFPTLGAAMLYTQRELLGRIGAFVQENLTVHANAREELLAVFRLSFEYTCLHPEIARFFMHYDFSFRRFGLVDDERSEYVRIAESTGAPFMELFARGQADGSIDPSLPVETTYLALQTSIVGACQRLLIETRWTTGTDETARAVHALALDVWRQALSPKR